MKPETKSDNVIYQVILIFLLLALGVGLAGYIYYIKEREHILNDKKNELSAIAELKVSQINDWRRERIKDGEAVFKSSIIAFHMKNFLDNTENPGLRQATLSLMNFMHEGYSYKNVLLMDKKGAVRLSTDRRYIGIGPVAKKLIEEAMRTKKVVFSDFHRGENANYIHIDVIAPLIISNGAKAVYIGALLFRIDPDEYLYPLIQKWPTQSKTAETLLVEREGDNVLYLNELRHRKNTALSLSVPISKKNFPAGRAVLGQKGIVEGQDYRDVKVLTAVRAVPDTPWFLIAKVDASEVYEPIRERARLVMIFVSAMIIATGLSVGFWWRQRRLEFYRREYKAVADLKDSEERFRKIFEEGPLGMVMVGLDNRFLKVNNTFCRMVGYTEDELTKLSFVDITHPDDIDNSVQYVKQLFNGEISLFKMSKRYIGKDGRVIWGNLTVTLLRSDEGTPLYYLSMIDDITEYKQAENALIGSEERYRRLVELSSDAIFVQSEGRIAFINPAGLKLFGAASSEELIGKPVLDLMHPDYRGIVNERIRILKEEKAEVPVLEEKYLRLDGSPVDVEVAATPFIYRGKPGAQVIARNITERKKMENILQKERDKAQQYLDIAGVMLVAIDATQRVKLINKKGCEVLGYCEEDIIGKNWFDNFVSERMRNEVKAVFNKMMRGEIEPVGHYENPVLTKSGEEKLISWHNALIADENGIISGTLSSGEDITGRKQAEEFVKNILESVDEGFIVIDPEYRIVSANKSYLNMVDIPAEDVIGKHCYEVSHHIYKPCCEAGQDCPVKDTFKTGNPCTAIHTHYDKEGNPVFVEIKSYPVKNESGEIVSAIEVITNITEKKKLEDQLRHSQKLEAIGTFAGGIAHDFNNILTAIIGYGNLLQMKMEADEPLRAYVDPILISAERAASLTHSLLAFSRKQIMNTRPVSLNEIVGVVKKLLLRLIGEDIEVKTLLSEDALTVMADPGQIEQVLINLATNARDAMQEGGVLSIITKAVELDNEFIMAHNYGKKGKYAFVSVTDTGTGMDKRTKEKIFDPFFTTKEVGKGTGLGLAIVYGIIKQHNGYINVYSEQGQGTTFNIYLPLTHKAEVKETKLAEIASSMDGAETVLLAEDEGEVRQITKTVLEKFGYKVIEAVDGEDAVNKFMENRDKIELLIFDVIMPRKTGKEAYEEIKKIRPDIRALFTSGYPVEIAGNKGPFEEGINFVPKPVSPTGLLKKVREILDKKRVDSIP